MSLETEAKQIIAEQEGIAVSTGPYYSCSQLVILLIYIVQEELNKLDNELIELKDEILKCEEEQQKLNDQILDHQHEQEKYLTVMKENQQKIKYYNSEVRGYGTMRLSWHSITYADICR